MRKRAQRLRRAQRACSVWGSVDRFVAGSDLRIKKARWWDRLGGRPVDHAASPRFVCCQEQPVYPILRNGNQPSLSYIPVTQKNEREHSFTGGDYFLPPSHFNMSLYGFEQLNASEKLGFRLFFRLRPLPYKRHTRRPCVPISAIWRKIVSEKSQNSVIPQLRVDFRAGGGTWQFQVNVVVGCARPLLAIENRSLPIRFKFKAGEFR